MNFLELAIIKLKPGVSNATLDRKQNGGTLAPISEILMESTCSFLTGFDKRYSKHGIFQVLYEKLEYTHSNLFIDDRWVTDIHMYATIFAKLTSI